MSERLNREFVGVDFNFSQYIQDNIEEAVSGVKGENSVKIFGRDLGELERLAKSLKSEISEVPGVTDPAAFNLLGQPNLVVRIDRAKAARYGFSVGDINAVVQAAVGGQEVTRVYEGEMNFALTVRLAPEYRRNIEAIRAIPVALPNSDPKAPTAYVALRDLGDVRLETGAAYIYRENTQRFVPLEIQRARSRSRIDRGGGATARQREYQASRRISDGMDRRVRRAGGGQEAARADRAAQPAADPDAALRPVQQRSRQPAGAVRHSIRGGRRNSWALRRRPQCQRVGRGRIHIAVRRVGHGWHSAGFLHPQKPGGGAWAPKKPSSGPPKRACGRYS